YKAQKRRLLEVLASYLSQLGGDFDLDQASMHSAPLPLASKLPPLAHPAQSAALIGDAASMINPLTGEGISYGMVAGLLLGRALADAIRRGQDLGPVALRYEKDFRARFSAHFRNNVALRGILRFRPLAERMVGNSRPDAGARIHVGLWKRRLCPAPVLSRTRTVLGAKGDARSASAG